MKKFLIILGLVGSLSMGIGITEANAEECVTFSVPCPGGGGVMGGACEDTKEELLETLNTMVELGCADQ